MNPACDSQVAQTEMCFRISLRIDWELFQQGFFFKATLIVVVEDVSFLIQGAFNSQFKFNERPLNLI